MAKKKSVSKAGASAPAVKKGASQEAPAPDAVVTAPVERQEEAPVVETTAPVETEAGATDKADAPDAGEKPLVEQKEELFPGRYTIRNMTRMPLALPVAKAEINAYGSGDVDIRDASHLKEIRRELDTLAELNGFKNDVFIVAPVAAQ